MRFSDRHPLMVYRINACWQSTGTTRPTLPIPLPRSCGFRWTRMAMNRKVSDAQAREARHPRTARGQVSAPEPAGGVATERSAHRCRRVEQPGLAPPPLHVRSMAVRSTAAQSMAENRTSPSTDRSFVPARNICPATQIESSAAAMPQTPKAPEILQACSFSKLPSSIRKLWSL